MERKGVKEEGRKEGRRKEGRKKVWSGGHSHKSPPTGPSLKILGTSDPFWARAPREGRGRLRARGSPQSGKAMAQAAMKTSKSPTHFTKRGLPGWVSSRVPLQRGKATVMLSEKYNTEPRAPPTPVFTTLLTASCV